VPIALPPLLRDAIERLIVALTVFTLFFSALFLWALSVMTCLIALAGASVHVISVAYGARRLAAPPIDKVSEPSLRNA